MVGCLVGGQGGIPVALPRLLALTFVSLTGGGGGEQQIVRLFLLSIQLSMHVCICMYVSMPPNAKRIKRANSSAIILIVCNETVPAQSLQFELLNYHNHFNY